MLHTSVQHQVQQQPSLVDGLSSSSTERGCNVYCQKCTEMACHLSQMYLYHNQL